MIYGIKKNLRKIMSPKFVLFTHKIRAFAAAALYGFPGKKIRAIGVAGTKGKTTTVNMIARMLESAGYKTAMLSTANFQIGEKKWLNDVKLTTTSPSYFQKFLKQAVEEKCEYVVVEISSHGLVQFRHWGVPYRTVVLTNMMSDHLDYHKTYENYKNSHRELLKDELENIILNYDDENLRSFLGETAAKKYVYSLKGYKEVKGADLLRAQDIVLGEKGSRFTVSFPHGSQEINLPLVGEFNIYNAVAAFAVAVAEKIGPGVAKRALESMNNIPGRLEKVDAGQDFEVIVDYAHSPDSLFTVYEALKPHVKNRIIAVLGGTGDRDKTYRAKGGALADKYADIVIVTNEDPYSEDPENIMDQVMLGVKNKTFGKNLFRVSDRKEAIEKACVLAQKGDLVIITGKGSEQFIIHGSKKIPWDDRAVAKEALRKVLSRAHL